MRFGIHWWFFALVESVQHGEDCHVEGQRRAIDDHCHYLRDNCFVVFHHYSSDDPVKNGKGLVVCEFADLANEQLLILF